MTGGNGPGVFVSNVSLLRDGHTSFTVQKSLEHFPVTVKHYLSFKRRYTIYNWVRNTVTSTSYSSRLNCFCATVTNGQRLKRPSRAPRLSCWLLTAVDINSERFLKQNRRLHTSTLLNWPAIVNIPFICTL